ncbi:MAG: ATP-dependent DNA helicase, partial [Chloroflexota bacterium]
MAARLTADEAFSQLERELRGFRRREGQILLSRSIEQALAGSGRLVAEAPTGTGKTNGLLVPALLSNKRIVIATYSNLLAGKMATEDAPRLQAALGTTRSVKLVKGRANYLCRHRLREKVPADEVEPIERRAAEVDGDLATMGISPELAREVRDEAFYCLRKRCEFYDECYSRLARVACRTADVVITNQAIMFTDIRTGDSLLSSLDRAVLAAVTDVASTASVAEELDGDEWNRQASASAVEGARSRGVEAVLLDEAHHVPEVATAALTSRVNARGLARMVERSSASEISKRRMARVLAALGDILERHVGATGSATIEGEDSDLATCLAALVEACPHGGAGDERSRMTMERIREAVGAAGAIRTSLGKDGMAVYVERRDDGVDLIGAPLGVGKFLKKWLYRERVYERDADDQLQVVEERERAAVAVSATLRSVGPPDGFGYFMGRTGLREAETLIVPSPFARDQAILYLPGSLPALPPDGAVDVSYASRIAPEISWACEQSSGGAFVLLTSWEWLRVLSDAVRPLTRKAIYLQEREGSRESLLDRFLANPGILLGV